jgi:peptide chain release factor 1
VDFPAAIDKLNRRYAEVENALANPEVFAQPQKAQELSREYARLKELVVVGAQYRKAGKELADNRELVAAELADSEMGQLAREEIARLEPELRKLELAIQEGVLPPEPTDSRNTIVEIRAGAGGAESALFAADLYRMYSRYADTHGWKIEPMDSSPSDLGGFRDITFQVNGTNAFKRLKFESGVHRVCLLYTSDAADDM